MLDQLRNDIASRLEEVLVEADKLRRALAVLDPRQLAHAPSTASTRSGRSRASSRTTSRSTTTDRRRTSPSVTTRSSPARASRSTSSKSTTRTAPGATKTAVMAALDNGDAMTAREVATATGIGQATVSTTLSRLAKAGEITKAARGYRAN
jgi:DNA-binding transcriptional ArsR family regulator